MLFIQTLNSVKFQNLAFFICHLLMGGHFQSVQVLFDPGSIDYILYQNIHSNCLNDISSVTIDISNSKVTNWNETVELDHVIQLILTGNDLKSEVLQLSKIYPNYYRIFIFCENGNDSFVPEISNKTKIDSNSNTIGIFHDAAGEIKVHLLHDNLMLFHQEINLIDLNELSASPERVFDWVFGEREKMRKLGIYQPNISRKKSALIFDFVLSYTRSMVNILYTQLKMDFIEIPNSSLSLETGGYFRPIPQKIYNELSWNIERISNSTEE